MNLITTPKKPQTLTLKLNCESLRHASGMRQVISETLKEFGYKKKDWDFKIEKGKLGKGNLGEKKDLE